MGLLMTRHDKYLRGKSFATGQQTKHFLLHDTAIRQPAFFFLSYLQHRQRGSGSGNKLGRRYQSVFILVLLSSGVKVAVWLFSLLSVSLALSLSFKFIWGRKERFGSIIVYPLMGWASLVCSVGTNNKGIAF